MAGPESGAYGPSLYRDDTFRLSVKFSEGYPLEPPEVRLTPRLGFSLGVPPHCPPWDYSALSFPGCICIVLPGVPPHWCSVVSCDSPAAAVHASTLPGTKDPASA